MAERAPADLSQIRGRLGFAGLLVGVVFVVGVVGYKLIGGTGHTWIQAVYMTANVLTTAGFREAIDIADSPAGMLFTVVLLFIGAGAVVYAISIITAFVIEGDLTQRFRRRRMRRAISEMSGHHIVCGAGATGYAVILELVKTDRPVVVIELDAARAARIVAELPDVPVLRADFTDDQVLLQAGVARALGLVICTTIDKDSLVTTITARQLNPGIRIIARAANERSMARLRQAGADGVVSPALIGGMRMASELVRPSVVSFLDMMLRDTDRNLRIDEIAIPATSPIIGSTVGELNAHQRTNCLLLAVKDVDRGTYSYNPPKSHRFTSRSSLIVMGDDAGVQTLHEVCGAPP
jgi:voltage-gated potassium channel